MRIDYLSAASIPSREANSIHVVRMCSALAAAGHRVRLFCRRAKAQNESILEWYGETAGVEIVRLPFRRLPLVGAAAYSIRVARSSRRAGLPDLYYARHIHSLCSVASGGVPMILECHAMPQSVWQDRAMRRLATHPALRRVVAISDALRQDLLEKYADLRPEQVMVAHDGADPPPRDLVPEAIEGRPNARLHVGYAGHLYPGKGMELIVQLPPLVGHADFHVVGGTPEDLAIWRGRVSFPNLFFHGFVSPARVQRFLAKFDVVIAPYQYRVAASGGTGDISRWMSPLKIFEYMAAGKSIVASDLPVLREILEDGRNALLCRPDKPGDWAAALHRLMDDPALAVRLGSAARDDFERQYSWKSRAERVVAS